MVIEKQSFKPGESGIVRLNVSRLPSDTKINIQAHVFRSKRKGPTALILAGVHGDEINGIEVVRRLLSGNFLDDLYSGSVIVIPLVNIYGFINFNRYVPDGKDVNRSFPGTLTGSLASRIARTLTKYILPHVNYIFDFHTGGDTRYNYPQVRYSKSDKEAAILAKIFNAPFVVQSGIIAKSLRKTAKDLSITSLIFEGGESVRLDGFAIDHGLKGLLNCIQHLKLIKQNPIGSSKTESILIKKTGWIRASYSGIFIWSQSSGKHVMKGERLGTIHDPNGQKTISVNANRSGFIIGHNNASVVNQGDALFHLGYESEIIK